MCLNQFLLNLTIGQTQLLTAVRIAAFVTSFRKPTRPPLKLVSLYTKGFFVTFKVTVCQPAVPVGLFVRPVARLAVCLHNVFRCLLRQQRNRFIYPANNTHAHLKLFFMVV